MIHDAVVEVTCDGEHCRESVYVTLDYTYGGVMHSRGSYDSDDEKVEERLEENQGWVVRDGKHYCSESCAPEAVEEETESE